MSTTRRSSIGIICLLALACRAPSPSEGEGEQPAKAAEPTKTARPAEPASTEVQRPDSDTNTCNAVPILPEDLYTDVVSWYEGQTGVTLDGPRGLDGGAAKVDLQLDTDNNHLIVPLEIGGTTIAATAEVSGPFIDTGSAGVTVDCAVLLANTGLDCSTLSVPHHLSDPEIYITDTKLTRCYGDGSNIQSGYVAVATVNIGGVSAAMPFALITKYDHPSQPGQGAAGAAVVGINPANGSNFVSPLYYFDYSASELDTGFVVDPSTLTIGVDPDTLGNFTLSSMNAWPKDCGSVPSSLCSQLLVPYVSATVSAQNQSGSVSDTVPTMFDTGTSGAGHIQLPTGDSTITCNDDCTVSAIVDDTAYANLTDVSFGVSIVSPTASPTAIIGVDFLIDNDGAQLLMDFSGPHIGFPSAQ